MTEFRAASAPSTPSDTAGQDKPSGPVSADKSTPSPGLFTHKSVKGQPMTVNHFNLQTFWDSETSGMHNDIEGLDEWVIEKAHERGLEDKAESYQEIMDEVLNQIGRSDNEKPHKTFERVKIAVEAIKRLEEAKIKPVLNVHTLTPKEYKGTRA